MSEFSESYHFRTMVSDEFLARLRKAGYSGFAFPPKRGWLTFIPFAFCKPCLKAGGADSLLTAVGETVLQHRYAADYGWSFSLHRPREKRIAYEHWWDPKSSTNAVELDLEALAEAVEVSSEAIKAFFSVPPSAGDSSRFAELLGLPAYRWVSPAYSQEDPESFIQKGAKMIGRRPKDVTEFIRCPPSRIVDLPRPDLSALEALATTNSLMKMAGAGWFAIQIHSQGGWPVTNASGRLAEGGQWIVTYRRSEKADYIKVGVNRSNGRVTALPGRIDFAGKHRLPEDAIDRTPPEPLPREILDSTQIASTPIEEPVPGHCEEAMRLMRLFRSIDGLLIWSLMRVWGRANGDPKIVMNQYFDARSGVILVEDYSRSLDGIEIEKWERVRDHPQL
ncbi:MAG TPA: hypothetical protein VGV37_06925 [Aliidongia sp.]|uniref:hypothetical protein n=1 Tax=Aliidongia sp. TaxID=1914230 RepID=UPI002DDCC29F|nr:hypothetical protein [Aliidongia sp.]HEV2674259.1 hypothetical protein [Aliidongia sp.]